MRIAGAIIAGGQGTRMGTPHKATVRLRDGSQPVQRLAMALQDAGCAPLMIVANDPAPYLAMGLQIVADRRANCGPLAGIEAALLKVAGSADAVCVVAGDMPRVSATELRRLIAGWDGRLAVAWTDHMQPLCAVVATSLINEVSQALDRGEHGIYRLWERLGAAAVRFESAEAFVDLDTPDDVARCQ